MQDRPHNVCSHQFNLFLHAAAITTMLDNVKNVKQRPIVAYLYTFKVPWSSLTSSYYKAITVIHVGLLYWSPAESRTLNTSYCYYYSICVLCQWHFNHRFHSTPYSEECVYVYVIDDNVTPYTWPRSQYKVSHRPLQFSCLARVRRYCSHAWRLAIVTCYALLNFNYLGGGDSML